MKPWELIDSADIPNSGGTMRLMRQGHNLVIHIDNRELMRNTVHGSEDALAELTCDRLDNRQRSRILIGGLGMGFTLAAALRGLGDDAQVVVAELVPAVVRWNRGLLGDAAGHPLADSRVSVYDGDVADLIRKPPALWDAILLDVDNGPVGLTRATNDQLYSSRGLDSAFSALKPRGILSVWSAAPDRGFARRFERAGFAVESINLRSRGRRGGRRHLIWLGIRKAEGPRWQRKNSTNGSN
jgi:spermidine synthase